MTRLSLICAHLIAVALLSGVSAVLAECRDPTSEPGRFRMRGVETTDTRTGLVWLRCPAGYVTPPGTCDAAMVLPSENWDGAMAIRVKSPPAPAGKWRLASIEELETIAAKGCGSPVNSEYIEISFSHVWTRSLAGDDMVWLLDRNGQRVKLPKKPRDPRTGGEFFAQTIFVRTAELSERRAQTGPAIASTPSPAPASGSVTVLIGHVAPLSGGLLHLGRDNENGARLAIDEANAARIKIGGRDATFVLVSEDDQGDPKLAVKAAQKLVDTKVAGVVGHLSSGASIPASVVYNDANIPMISGSATNPTLTARGLGNVFRVIAHDGLQGSAIARVLLMRVLATNPRPTIAIVDDATPYGEEIANDVESALKVLGIHVLPRQKGTDRTTEWRPVLMNVKSLNADAVFYGGMDDTGGLLLKQGRESGITGIFAFADGACTARMGELAGPAAEGLLCAQTGIPVEAASRRFLDAYRAKFRTSPIVYAPFTYDATNLLIEAMKKAGSADPVRYLSELKAIEYTGATGRIAFDAKGDRVDAEISIYTMVQGRLTPIAISRGTQHVQWLRSPAGEDFSGPAIAKVNGTPIPTILLDATVQSLVSQGRSDTESLRKDIRNSLVNSEVVMQEAVSTLGATPPIRDLSTIIKAQAFIARQQVIVKGYFDDYFIRHPITDDVQRSEYESARSRTGDVEYKVRHILVGSEVEARDIIARLKRGEKFEELAKTSRDTGTRDRGGELNWTVPSGFDRAFADGMTRLQKGQFTELPVRTRFGWHIVRVDDVRPVRFPSFDEVKQRIQVMLRQRISETVIGELRARAKLE